MSCRRAIHKLLSANSVVICAVFFFSPRYLTFVKPNCLLSTRNGCSTFARMLAFIFSILGLSILVSLAYNRVVGRGESSQS